MAWRKTLLLLASLLLVGCGGALERSRSWTGGLVEVLVVMNENGQCDVVYDGMHATQPHINELTTFDRNDGSRYLIRRCHAVFADRSEWENLHVQLEFITEHAPYVDALINSSTAETRLIDLLGFYPATPYPDKNIRYQFGVSGKKAGQSLFCIVQIKFNRLVLVANAGVDGNLHIAVGAGSRWCKLPF